MLGHNMRYMDFVLKMREIIQSGMIGEVKAIWCRHFVSYGGDAYFRDWHADRAKTGSLLLQKGAHDIDVIHWLANSRTTRVSGIGSLSVYGNLPRREKEKLDALSIEEIWGKHHWPPEEQKDFSPFVNNEDINMVNLQLANGVHASYMQCHYTPDAERNYTFIGTKGRVENIGDSGKCQIHVWTRRGRRNEPDIIHQLKPVTGTHGGADDPIVDNFLDFVANGALTNANPVAARNSVAAGVLGHYSMRNGNIPQDIPELEPEILEYFANNQR